MTDPTFGLHPHSLRFAIRSSRFYQVFWFIVMIGLTSLTIWFGLNNKLPLPIVLFSGGGFAFIAFVQLFPVISSFKTSNWLAKFYHEGVLLQIRKSNGDRLLVVIPTSAIRSLRFNHQNIKIPRRNTHRYHRGFHTTVKSIVYLEIEANKQAVKNHRQETAEKNKMMTVKFLYYPVTEIADGYRIELKSHRTNTMPGINSIKKQLGNTAILIIDNNETLDLVAENDDKKFDAHMIRLVKEGFDMDATDAIRKKYTMSLSQARQYLKQITR